MNNITKSFLSPLLAQAKLRFSGNKNNSGGSMPQCSIVATNPCNNTMTSNSNISEIPTLEKEQYSDIDLTLSDAIGEKHSYRKHTYLEFLETRGLAR